MLPLNLSPLTATQESAHNQASTQATSSQTSPTNFLVSKSVKKGAGNLLRTLSTPIGKINLTGFSQIDKLKIKKLVEEAKIKETIFVNTLNQYDESIEGTEQNIVTANNALRDLSEDLEDLEDEKEGLENDRSWLLKRKDEANEAKIESLSKKIRNIDSRLRSLKKLIEDYSKDLETEETKLSKLETQKIKLESELTEKRGEFIKKTDRIRRNSQAVRVRK